MPSGQQGPVSPILDMANDLGKPPIEVVHGRVVESAFQPAWWLPGAHLQTLWPFLCRRRVPTIDWERLELPDGDFIDLAWHGSGRHLCVLLHGLEGNVHSHYLPGLMQSLAMAGWRSVVMHFRGCSGEPNRLARSYHSGETGDLSYVIELLIERERPAILAAVGFSLGGNVLLKYLGERGADTKLAVACAVSVPFDLAIGAARLEQGLSRLYQWWLIRALQRKVCDKFSQCDCPIALDTIKGQNSFRQFDGAVTAPLHGFRDADDYYHRSSSRSFLKSIAVPTLILHALDDPFLGPTGVPHASELAPTVRLELSRYGGHVGFVGGSSPLRPQYWLEHRIPAFLAEFKNVKQSANERG